MSIPSKLRFFIRSRSAAIAAVAILMAASMAMSGCGKPNGALVSDKVNVVTTFYPLYFFAEQIGGEDAHVINLVPAGVEPHDWTPKSKELKMSSEAQIFLYNGAGLEGWTDDFLQGLGAGNRLLTVEASKGIPLIDSDGASGEPHEGESADDGHDHGELHADPHTWVSPKSALMMAANIRDAYIEADPAHQKGYEARYAALANQLTALDSKFGKQLAPFQGSDIVVTHQSFGYLCRDYGLRQTAVMGLSPDAEPRAQDMVNIIRYIKDRGIRVVFFEELVSNRLAETIAAETDVETLVLNPVEGLTPEQLKSGETYFTLMERNLQNLQKALQ